MKKKIIAGFVFILLSLTAVYFIFPGAVLNLLVNLSVSSAGLTKKNITVGTHNIVYHEGGKGETILMLHGFNADKSNWTKFSKFITPSYRVIAIDIPGFGDSSRIQDETYKISDQVQRLNEFIKILKINKFHVVGNSMGGAIAGMYTVTFPDKILSLGLFNTGGIHSPVESEYSKLRKKGENKLIPDSPESFDALLKFAFYKPPSIPGPIKKVILERTILNAKFSEKIFSEITLDISNFEKKLKKIKVNTLIMWGDKDRILDISSVEILKKKISNSTVVILKDCGHLPMVERPDESSDYYLKFLENLK